MESVLIIRNTKTIKLCKRNILTNTEEIRSHKNLVVKRNLYFGIRAQEGNGRLVRSRNRIIIVRLVDLWTVVSLFTHCLWHYKIFILLNYFKKNF